MSDICPRCGTTLPTLRIKRPVYIEHYEKNLFTKPVMTDRVISHYEYKDEVGDCVRCTGSY